jgi:16S rRNA (adenine(1408)-N(1))-methyltransferase
MRVLEGRNQIEMNGERFARMASGCTGVDLDIGTGDGRFVLDRAAAYPERLVIGLDPVAEAMAAAANRISRRKTRQENALFVVASVEQMPEELIGVADRVFINLPWGSLMRGLILPDDDILRAVVAVGAPGARYRIILNLRIFEDPVPVEVRELPEVTPDYVNDVLAARYLAAGMDITSIKMLSPSELAELRTSWSRRLSHRSPPPSIELRGRRVPV